MNNDFYYKINEKEINFKNLCEEIWDLFYDDLAIFLSFLWDNCKYNEVWTSLKNASTYIEDAWDICKKHTLKGDINSKHTSKIKSINLDNQELAKKIWNLDKKELRIFLIFLSLKISRDSYADKMRGRENLSNSLKWCASSLLEAYEILENEKEKSSNIKNSIEIKINNLLWLH